MTNTRDILIKVETLTQEARSLLVKALILSSQATVDGDPLEALTMAAAYTDDAATIVQMALFEPQLVCVCEAVRE